MKNKYKYGMLAMIYAMASLPTDTRRDEEAQVKKEEQTKPEVTQEEIEHYLNKVLYYRLKRRVAKVFNERLREGYTRENAVPDSDKVRELALQELDNVKNRDYGKKYIDSINDWCEKVITRLKEGI